MLLMGIAVVRAGIWSGWRKFSPLIVGQYLLVMVFGYPLLESYQALTGGGTEDLDLVLRAIWFLCWLPLGVALSFEARDRQTVKPGVTA